MGEKNGVKLEFIKRGRPDQNASIERFNRSYREAVFDKYLFKNLVEVRFETAKWLERTSAAVRTIHREACLTVNMERNITRKVYFSLALNLESLHDEIIDKSDVFSTADNYNDFKKEIVEQSKVRTTSFLGMNKNIQFDLTYTSCFILQLACFSRMNNATAE